MWKKSETTAPPVAPVQSPRPESPRPSARSTKACIGSGIFLKGELHGEEDIVIEGRIEGKVRVEKHSVIIGESGRVDADVSAANVSIAGQVRGNVSGTDRVVLLESARVEGNISAKSVTLENGCRFKGSIDMESSRPEPSVETKPNGGGPAVRSGGVTHGTVRTS
jgi:cytoskeletal protein CcmA (bactofilin family)